MRCGKIPEKQKKEIQPLLEAVEQPTPTPRFHYEQS
jgi:hypothetical protein